MTIIRIDGFEFQVTQEGLSAAIAAAHDQWYDMTEVTEAMGPAYDTAASNFANLAKAARQLHKQYKDTKAS